jgi:hypothetical protein
MTVPDETAVVETLRAVLAQVRSDAGQVGTDVLLEALSLLRGLREEIAAWEPELIAAARAAGTSWALLAPTLGVTSRQAAERRYLRLRPTDGGETTGEARVQVTRDERAGDRAVSQWARGNAATLRELAGQVSALADLDTAGRHQADQVHTALGGDDPATLLVPLTEAKAHVALDHPRLADRITTVTADAERQRRNAVRRRQAGRSHE